MGFLSHIRRPSHPSCSFVAIAENPADAVTYEEELGALVPVTCPECGGPLWGLHTDRIQRYRCRLGHAFTAESLLAGQSEGIETALWTAVRTMEERARVLTLLVHEKEGQKRNRIAERYAAEATELKTHAQHIRQLLLSKL